jgi:hypothetical protein
MRYYQEEREREREKMREEYIAIRKRPQEDGLKK